MTKRKHWSDRKTKQLYALKEGDKFYVPDEISFLPYTVVRLPTDNGIMVYCEKPSGKKDYYHGSLQVVKEKLTDINPEL